MSNQKNMKVMEAFDCQKKLKFNLYCVLYEVIWLFNDQNIFSLN